MTISRQKTAFLVYELESGAARRQRRALQEICRLYRSGHRFAPSRQYPVELIIAGLTVNSRDEKVVRWGLNAIARLGKQGNSSHSVESALKRHEENPEIVAAAVSALAALYRGNLPELPGLEMVSPETRALAAMQTVPPTMLKHQGLAINLDQADPETLKLGLIVVGLNKDIQNLLHPRYENSEIVKELGQHDDVIVRQYSVWAVMENEKLTLEHLGISFSDLERQPDNVQAKMLQLGAQSIPDLVDRQSLIIQGSNSPSMSAREGLAKGLVTTFYDGLQDATLNWYDTENSDHVRLPLALHFARYSDDCPSYFDKALEIAEESRELHEHVMLGAEGRPLYSHLVGKGRWETLNLFSPEHDPELSNMISTVKTMDAITILILCATPDDLGRIRADKEVSKINEKLSAIRQPQRQLTIESCYATRLDQIQSELLSTDAKILHFSGHGNNKVLAFENADGTTAELGGDVFGDIIAAYGRLECMVLHACYSESIATACSKHVPIVISSRGTVDDSVAPAFSGAFYQALASGRPYQNAFDIGRAEVSTVSKKEAKKYILIE